ncbi:thioredoxin family protein [Streptomyces sp. NPDC058579]|uniref:thioredoxin family protein n=1 Tax=Streptomyces sp. NPDC058579 TaxID=3346548 RepID=UPI003647C315
MTHVTDVSDTDFDTEVLGAHADLPVLVKFTADWCPPCRQLTPVLEAIAEEERDRLKIVQINVDHNPQTTIRYGVMATPTLMLFRAGEPVKSMVGARPKRLILKDLEDVLPPARSSATG